MVAKDQQARRHNCTRGVAGRKIAANARWGLEGELLCFKNYPPKTATTVSSIERCISIPLMSSSFLISDNHN